MDEDEDDEAEFLNRPKSKHDSSKRSEEPNTRDQPLKKAVRFAE